MTWLLLGLVAGILSGLLGVGGGVVLVPVMHYLKGVPIHSAVAISLAVIVPTALIGAWKYFSVGHGDLKITLWIGAGAVLGAYLGAYLGVKMPTLLLQRLFGVFLILVGIYMVFSKGSSEPQEESVQKTAVPGMHP